MLSISYFRLSTILRHSKCTSTRRKIVICQQAGFSAIYALRAREADMPNCRQFFGLDKRPCPKVKVSVRNYTVIRRFFKKKASRLCELPPAVMRRTRCRGGCSLTGGSPVELDDVPSVGVVSHCPCTLQSYLCLHVYG